MGSRQTRRLPRPLFFLSRNSNRFCVVAAAEGRRKAEEAEKEKRQKQSQLEAGVSDGKPAAPRPEADGVDEEGFPVYSPRKLDAMETGQIVIQFLK